MIKIKEYLLPFCGLFASISTILCCGLPIILVTLGMGAVFANLTASFTFITWLTEKSIYLFAIAIILLVIGRYFIFIKSQACPADRKLAAICHKSKKFNKIIWWISAVILVISFFFKYILILLIS